MMKLNIKYLKAGSIDVDIPTEVLSKGTKAVVQYCQNQLEDLSDYVLKNGLSDYLPENDDFFDETPEVEQISYVDFNYKELFSTSIWDKYINSSSQEPL